MSSSERRCDVCGRGYEDLDERERVLLEREDRSIRIARHVETLRTNVHRLVDLLIDHKYQVERER